MASAILAHLRGVPGMIVWLVVLCAASSSSRDLNPSLRMAEADAVAAWSAALHVALDSPRIQVGDCPATADAGFRTVACADREAYSINLSARLLHPGIDADLRTILMHEIGHLLTVPHMPGDELMDPEPHILLTRPSQRAIEWASGIDD